MMSQLDQVVREQMVAEYNRRLLEASKGAATFKAAFPKKTARLYRPEPTMPLTLRRAVVLAVTLLALWLGTEIAVAASAFFGGGGGGFLLR